MSFGWRSQAPYELGYRFPRASSQHNLTTNYGAHLSSIPEFAPHIPPPFSNVRLLDAQPEFIPNASCMPKIGDTNSANLIQSETRTSNEVAKTNDAPQLISKWHSLYANKRFIKQQNIEAQKNEISLLDVKHMLYKLHLFKLMNLTKQAETEESAIDNLQVLTMLQVLEDGKTKELVKHKVIAAKKRKVRRQACSSYKLEKMKHQQRKIEDCHIKIDKWLAKIEDDKQTQAMLKSADESLSGVRQKIADVNKLKELVSSLVKLRSIRVQSSEHQGKDDDPEKCELFVKKTSELMSTLEKRLDMYKKEEAALKVMLKHEQDEQRAEKLRLESLRKLRLHERQEKKTEVLLFGNQEVEDDIRPFYEYYTQADREINALVAVRSEWDKYIVNEGGSQIPKLWVVPTAPSSEAWSEYLTLKSCKS